MKLKELVPLVYSPILLVIDDKEFYPMSRDYIPETYNNYEVIGVRALNAGSTRFEDAVVISIKEPLYASENLGNIWHESKDLRNTSICKEVKD